MAAGRRGSRVERARESPAKSNQVVEADNQRINVYDYQDMHASCKDMWYNFMPNVGAHLAWLTDSGVN